MTSFYKGTPERYASDLCKHPNCWWFYHLFNKKIFSSFLDSYTAIFHFPFHSSPQLPRFLSSNPNPLSRNLTILTLKQHTPQKQPLLLLERLFILLYPPIYHWFWSFLTFQQPKTQSIPRHSCLSSQILEVGTQQWFAFYWSDMVTWKTSTSAPCWLSMGVPQGSVLGILPFSIYTHSLPPSVMQILDSQHVSLFHALVIPQDNSWTTPSENACIFGWALDKPLFFSPHVANLTQSCWFLL